MRLFDAHTHLWDRQFDADRAEVIRRMEEAGVGAIQVGTEFKTSEAAIALAEANESFWATVGQHPTDTNTVFDAAAFEKLAAHPNVVAIGECGLDYYAIFARERSERSQKRASAKAFSDGGLTEEKKRQENIFRSQIRLAKKLAKPLMIHCRPSLLRQLADSGGQAVAYSADAYDDVLKILAEEHFEGGGAAHFFVGTSDIARRFLDVGFCISFSGVITITPMYDEVARAVPADKILIETDAPYAAPMPYRGTRNEPPYVKEVAKRLAEIRGATSEEIAEQTAENAKRIFRLQ
ncbi:MAG: TatD family hydrolase [Candidatus Niyogibacteria bacterium]|nr:TatD family hydrolase [Candidatus Niyogibacteria bacterium]